MAWLNDVAPYTTIQSQWGNEVRNRIVQTFADVNERNAHTAALPDGVIVSTIAEEAQWQKRFGGWYPLTPARIAGQTFQQFMPGGDGKLAALNIPPGFRRAVFFWTGRSDQVFFGNEPWIRIDWKLYAPGAVLVFNTQQDVVGNRVDHRDHHSFSVSTDMPNPAAVNYYQLNVTVASTFGQRAFRLDGSQSFSAIAFP